MKKIICIVFVLFLIALCAYFGLRPNGMNPVQPDTDAVKWTGEQVLPSVSTEIAYIRIPKVPDFVFVTDSLEQKVNLYNPEQNNCLMKFTVTICGEIIWQSGWCEPGCGYYDIELTRLLESGVYDAEILMECMRDNIELNSAVMHNTIIVQ